MTHRLQNARLLCPRLSPGVGDAIQPSHCLSPPSPPALNLSQHQGLSNESALLVRWPKCWRFSISPSSEYSELISFRNDCLDLLDIQGTQESFPTVPQFKSISSLVLSLMVQLSPPDMTTVRKSTNYLERWSVWDYICALPKFMYQHSSLPI